MSLAQKTARSALWTVLCGLVGRGAGLVSTFVITRYISPLQYGAVSVASVLAVSADELTRGGLYQYLVAKPEAGRATAFHATLLHLVAGVIALGAVLLLRRPLALLLHAPLAADFLLGLTLSSFFDRVSAGPETILHRDMRFGAVGLSRAAGDVVFASSVIVLAVAGFGGYAIVYANIAQWGLLLLLFTVLTHWREWVEPHPLERQQVRGLLAFGLPLALGHLANHASRRWDNLLFSRFFGATVVGHYNLAYNLADMPATYIGESIGDVLLPSFARIEREQRPAALLRALRLLMLLMCPLALGLAVVAPTVIHSCFDARWGAAAPMLALLAALSLARPVSWTVEAYLQSCGQTRAIALLQLAKVAAVFGSIALLAPLGPLWACAAVAPAFALQSLGGLYVIKEREGIALRRLLAATLTGLPAAALMAGAVLALRQFVLVPADLDNCYTALAAEVSLGALVYPAAALLLAPRSSRELLGVVVGALRRDVPSPTGGDGPGPR
ncbi:MAG: oligosaccharide flippase family protein [Proteobacteria bacterium]|nr:oligosaccharide flippase family protein [Pseudomonadota bacterium]